MADAHPELQAKLHELDHELAEGDITQKGSVRRVHHFPTAICTSPSPSRHVTSLVARPLLPTAPACLR
jgi:hypothetical protein